MDGDTISMQQAADLCGMAYRTMRAMILRGDLPAEMPGKEWRPRRADVEAFIERSQAKRGQLKAARPGIPPRRKADA